MTRNCRKRLLKAGHKIALLPTSQFEYWIEIKWEKERRWLSPVSQSLGSAIRCQPPQLTSALHTFGIRASIKFLINSTIHFKDFHIDLSVTTLFGCLDSWLNVRRKWVESKPKTFSFMFAAFCTPEENDFLNKTELNGTVFRSLFSNWARLEKCKKQKRAAVRSIKKRQQTTRNIVGYAHKIVFN